jgi:antitoxin YefM
MLAVNYTTVRNNLKGYCDKVTEECETVIVTRKDEKNIVIISLDEYNSLMKVAKKAAYFERIDRAMEQLARGEGTVHELIEVDDD